MTATVVQNGKETRTTANRTLRDLLSPDRATLFGFEVPEDFKDVKINGNTSQGWGQHIQDGDRLVIDIKDSVGVEGIAAPNDTDVNPVVESERDDKGGDVRDDETGDTSDISMEMSVAYASDNAAGVVAVGVLKALMAGVRAFAGELDDKIGDIQEELVEDPGEDNDF